MGDFNADCDYVKEQHWDSISLWTRPEFTWAIPRTEDTTTNYRSCALDRIVYAGENMNSGVILSSAKAFDYRYEFDVTMQEVCWFSQKSEIRFEDICHCSSSSTETGVLVVITDHSRRRYVLSPEEDPSPPLLYPPPLIYLEASHSHTRSATRFDLDCE
ncbi:hypothetical protein AVEN_59123-1 [Araneus ventricosus]|uniref:Endonuclease/exonuclease/phosphatase domain-containing protein n=1 Tax=Araneus ventricosus TaxID=182803 RepID=A0A4Y1ZYK1_ARAVE|nr:hypothetical protein AVEN_59123-1 [Araneus ventricosus]